MRLGKETIFAQTDGGLQIIIPRKDDEGNEIDDEVIYERAYYKLALEVNCPRFLFFFGYYLLTWASQNNFIKCGKWKKVGIRLKWILNLPMILFMQDKYSLKCSLLSHILNSILLNKKYVFFSRPPNIDKYLGIRGVQ